MKDYMVKEAADILGCSMQNVYQVSDRDGGLSPKTRRPLTFTLEEIIRYKTRSDVPIFNAKEANILTAIYREKGDISEENIERVEGVVREKRKYLDPVVREMYRDMVSSEDARNLLRVLLYGYMKIKER